MSLSCVTGGKVCTGCMDCYDDREIEEESREMSEEDKADAFEALDGVKLAIMDLYGLDEYDAVSVISEYVEAR